MKKEEILEINKRCNKNSEDEMEEYINGKAGLTAKIVFCLIVALLSMYKKHAGMPIGDIWFIFTAYLATELFYKYYYLRNKRMLLSGILFTISSICCLAAFIISTYV